MKNTYKFYTALLLGLLGVQGISAQTTENNVERTKQILTFGDWNDLGNEFGIDTEKIPTQVKDFYYNNKGKLVQTIESNVLLGDNVQTLLKVEKLGDLHPLKNTRYQYDDSDRLTAVVEQQYATENGWFFNWMANDTLYTYSYNTENQLISKSDKDFTYNYTWNGNQMQSEKKVEKKSGNEVASRYFKNFINDSDKATKVVEVEGANARIIELEYNENLQLCKSTSYLLLTPQTDANGNILDGEKGEALEQTVYTYNNGLVQTEVISKWNAAQNKYVETTKKETLLNQEKGGYETISYAAENGDWKKIGAITVDIKNKYDLTVPVADITTEAAGLRANTVLVSFMTPEDITGDVEWMVYRNGELLGKADLFDGRWQYLDKELPNGSYNYYVMAKDTIDSPISNISSFVTDTTMLSVNNIRVVESGKSKVINEEGNQTDVFACHLAWDAPQTKNTILGYNVYLNPQNGGEDLKPVNEQLIKTPYYELTLKDANKLENNVIVEVVYAIGYLQSNPVTVQINPENVINENRLNAVSKIVTYGNTMGTMDETTRSKEEIHYYNANHQLMMTVSNGFLHGDDPDTPEIEEAGDYVATQYVVYDYNEKQQLIAERCREYGVFSGYDKAWSNELKTLATYKYDENSGKLIEKVDLGSKAYQYQWEGENLVKEFINSVRNGKQSPLAEITYSNFVEGKSNLPQNGLSVCKSPYMTSFNRIYEYEYDAMGHKIIERCYKYGDNVEKDEEGNIVKADKGTPVSEEFWEYEGGQLKRYIQNKWKSSEKALCPYSKKEFIYTANGVREEGYTYTDQGTTKGWTKSSLLTETVNNVYYGDTAPGTLTVTDIEDHVNSVRLTCDIPERNYGDSLVYEVFRNGTKIGEATPNAEGKLSFDDIEVENGIWHYIVKPASNYQSVDFLSTNVVEKVFDTTLPAVEDITFPVNGKKNNGDYQLVVSWNKPQTDLKILGYNVFTDIKSYTKNPSPVNGVNKLSDSTFSYEFNWSSTTRTDKTVCIEVVYNIGKKKSENIAVKLNDTPTGIVSAKTTAHLAIVNNQILVNGEYLDLNVYATNGTCVARGNGNSNIDLSNIPNGIYLVKMTTQQGTETMKVVKK